MSRVPPWLIDCLTPDPADPLRQQRRRRDRARRLAIATRRELAGDLSGARRVLFGRCNALAEVKAFRRRQHEEWARAAQERREREREREAIVAPLVEQLRRLEGPGAPLAGVLDGMSDPERRVRFRAAFDPADFAVDGAGKRRRLRVLEQLLVERRRAA